MVMLQLVRFRCAGVWIWTGLPCVCVCVSTCASCWLYVYSVLTCAKFDVHRAFQSVTFAYVRVCLCVSLQLWLVSASAQVLMSFVHVTGLFICPSLTGLLKGALYELELVVTMEGLFIGWVICCDRQLCIVSHSYNMYCTFFVTCNSNLLHFFTINIQ
jgi:hypothetical protein